MNCPLCDTESQGTGPAEQAKVICPNCGTFVITYEASESIHDMLTRDNNDLRYLVSGYTREWNVRNAPNRRADGRPPLITMASIQDYLKAAPPDASDKADRLMVSWSLLCPSLGQKRPLENSDYPLGYCQDYSELLFLIQHLQGQKLMDYKSGDGFGLSMDGWNRVRELRQVGVLSTQVFVAMWFDDTMNDVYDRGFAPAIERANYRPLRIDRIQHSDRME